MTIGFPRFDKQFASGGLTTPLSDAQAAAGWSFLGTSPPTVEEFNAMMQSFDDKDNWLFDNIATLATNAGVAAPADGDFTTLYKSIIAIFRGGGGAVPVMTGTATAYLLANPIPATAYINGQNFRGKINVANGASPTLKVDGLAAIPIVGLGAPLLLQGGEMPLNSIASFEILISASINSGNPIAVLQNAPGGALQVAAATQSFHALQYQQAQSMQGNYQGVISLSANTALVASQFGSIVAWSGASGGVLTLPVATSLAQGKRIKIYNYGAGTLTINTNSGTDNIYAGTSTTVHSIVLQFGDDIELIGRASNSIDIVGGSAARQFFPLTVGPALAAGQAVQFGQVAAPVGYASNVLCINFVAGSSLTFTGDQIIVSTALNGLSYSLSGFNQTLSKATAGIGGLDTGTVAANSWYAIYAAYNPTTQTQGIFYQLEPLTGRGASLVYSGANLPAGYTATALIGVWRTDASANFMVASIIDGDFSFVATTAVSGAGTVAAPQLISLTTQVPRCAKTARGILSITVSSAGFATFQLFSQTQTGSTSVVDAGPGQSVNFDGLSLLTVQNIWFVATPTAGTISQYNASITGFKFKS